MATRDGDFDLIAETLRNWGERGLREANAMAAATSLARAHQVVLGRINQALSDHDLTFSRYEALALLSFARNNSMGMARMGERLQVHPTSVTSTIDRLERDGLVVRAPNPDDRRATLATLTDGGLELLEKATASLESIRWGMGSIVDDELDGLTTGLANIRSSAGDNTTETLPEKKDG